MTTRPKFITQQDKKLQSYWCQKSTPFTKNMDTKMKMWNDRKAQKYFEDLKNGWREETDDQLILNTMRTLLKDINERADFLLSSKTSRFLDIGAACGGFSRYMLDMGHYGIGITLPIENGGHEMLIDEPERYETIYHDITESLPHLDGCFDFVLCDATFLGGTDHATTMKIEYDEQKWLHGM